MKIKVELQLIELEDDNLHLLVASEFGEGETGNWIVDTGASKTVFNLTLEKLYTPERDKTEQLHTAGIGENPIKTTMGRLSTFSMGRLRVENLLVALLDLEHVNRFYSQATGLEICGLLGSDFLLTHKAVIDYKRKLLILEAPKK